MSPVCALFLGRNGSISLVEKSGDVTLLPGQCPQGKFYISLAQHPGDVTVLGTLCQQVGW